MSNKKMTYALGCFIKTKINKDSADYFADREENYLSTLIKEAYAKINGGLKELLVVNGGYLNGDRLMSGINSQDNDKCVFNFNNLDSSENLDVEIALHYLCRQSVIVNISTIFCFNGGAMYISGLRATSIKVIKLSHSLIEKIITSNFPTARILLQRYELESLIIKTVQLNQEQLEFFHERNPNLASKEALEGLEASMRITNPIIKKHRLKKPRFTTMETTTEKGEVVSVFGFTGNKRMGLVVGISSNPSLFLNSFKEGIVVPSC